MNVSQPMPSAIGIVDFAPLSAQDIRSISVKKIENPTTFDSLLHPVPGGLYDLALGALRDNVCKTCNLGEFACPGHVGHIELPVPVYHPIFMNQVLRLLRAQCGYCQHLKLSKEETHKYVCKLRLLQYGLLAAVHDIEHIEKLEGDEAELSNASDEESAVEITMRKRSIFVKRCIKSARTEPWEWRREKNEGVAEARRLVIKDFMRAITAIKQCRKCGGISPTYRKDRYVKILEKSLNSRDKASMVEKNLKLVDAVASLQDENKARNQSAFKDEGIADLSSSDKESDEMDGDELDAYGNLIKRTFSAGRNLASSKKDVKNQHRFINTVEVRAKLAHLFNKEYELLSVVYNSRATSSKKAVVNPNMFFLQTLLVPPNKFRPEARIGDGEISEASQNSLYKAIMRNSEAFAHAWREITHPERATDAMRRRDMTDLQGAWCKLQDAVNSLIDRDRNPIQGNAGKKSEDGIKQVLEKKEGLFRQNMMGKRVNFAARSVISPDPNIETNEIGVPPVFAKKLTFPEPVTSHNFREMQQAVINGNDIWPGAAAIENENGQVISLRTKTQDERLALSNQLLALSSNITSGSRNKKVHRHLTNGDVVLMNRQPTLHKPSIMGHRARVLPGEKTIRMHYANCHTYNADFDGDEMNMHFPQTELGRAEALQIADTDHQYLVATSGKPLRGLIQDHISVSVWLCNLDTLFDRAAYQQLIYNCARPECGHIVGDRIYLIPPAIMKPMERWTGKQIITTILKNITPVDCSPLVLTGRSQTPFERWGSKSEEGVVRIDKGEFVTGILDKAQIGPSEGGLIHAIHEVYGPTVAGKMLGILGRLLTKFLHMRAFTCGMDDLQLTLEGERVRTSSIQQARYLGLGIAAKYVSLEKERPTDMDQELLARLEDVFRDDTKHRGLDVMMNAQTGLLTSAISKACLPDGLLKPFPQNQMQTMTVSGAKGSAVNANLISCNLGQQFLEARRVPVMASGRSLPCFRAFETNIRAGGYISDRFLTGIRPPEYYFHAMAGREGLIDTAVKTSRSGYLQRCLIKGMEGLKVEYDTSVRDSDGSMIQYVYGEDGLDVTKQMHLSDFDFLLRNLVSELAQLSYGEPQYDTIFEEKDRILTHMKKAIKHVDANDLCGPDPVLSDFNPGKYGYSTSEKYFRFLSKYLKTNSSGLVKNRENPNGVGVRKALEQVLVARYLQSVVDPGEAVGIVAGQSVGEPSTQMTLNTFHLAGHSAKNVTQGIPRLREIIMTASSKISTPTMTLRLIPEMSEEEGEQFAKAISVLTLAEVIDEATVEEIVAKGFAYPEAKIYNVHIKLFPSQKYTQVYAIDIADVLAAFETRFVRKLQMLTRKALGKKRFGKTKQSRTAAVPDIGISVGTVEQARADANSGADDDAVESDDDEVDATDAKQRADRKEVVSYAANDADDDAIQAQAQKDSMSGEDEDDEETGEGIGSSIPVLGSYVEKEDGEDEQAGSDVRHLSGTSIEREGKVMKQCSDVTAFRFDEHHGEWCDIRLEYEAEESKILMLSIVKKALHKSLIQTIPGISKCTYVPQESIMDLATGKKIKVPVIHTEGVNLRAMRHYTAYINPNTISTNDIVAMLDEYGVEACRATIIQELHSVFSAHTICVDHRHLSLIADYMTRGGGLTPFNRNGLKGNVSPFTKMSFETTVGFLADAVTDGDWDDLRSPSSRIVVGRMSKIGTGSFDVLTSLPTVT